MGVILKIVGAVVLYVVTKAVYNLTLHPLARYPGPKSWIISRVPYLFSMNSGRLPYTIKALHDNYGPIVRVAADELSINDPQAWKDIYNRKDLLRPPQWANRPPGVEAHSLISAPAEDHARFRKAINPAFNERATKEYEAVVRKYFDTLLSHFDSIIDQGNGSGVVDIIDWANYAFFDIIGEITWSQSYSCLETGTGHASMGVLLHFQAFLIAATIKYFPWLDALLAAITPKAAFKALEEIFEDSHERLERRMASTRREHPDVVHYLREQQAKAGLSEKMSEAEIEQNLLLIIVGGSETLTSAISGAFHCLLANPEAFSKLVREVRSTFSNEDEITAAATSKLVYLNAVIDETLRLCPPFPDTLRRYVPASGAIIAGHAIPASTTVSVSCYSMFKASAYFSEPEHFIPERWIDGRDGAKAIEAFKPFAQGPHNCAGQALARMELRLFLALILWKYDIKMIEGERLRKWEEQKVYWTWEKQPLRVQLSHVKR
ncbi:cytochrome P450 [Lophiotrema nucula]|uniref:Cytochrome P450 n=1 Tax=Lophiotrema nucula TaxID=690887 RepID=A0A6A5YJQ0_9PLEO|nr:cytochrome P450 [Lophiotrema nucula]